MDALDATPNRHLTKMDVPQNNFSSNHPFCQVHGKCGIQVRTSNSGDDLCLLFCIYPSSIYYREILQFFCLILLIQMLKNLDWVLGKITVHEKILHYMYLTGPVVLLAFDITKGGTKRPRPLVSCCHSLLLFISAHGGGGGVNSENSINVKWGPVVRTWRVFCWNLIQ